MAKKLNNIIGLRKEKLEVIKELPDKRIKAGKRYVNQRWVECKCDCGKLIQCPLIHITRTKGGRKSCGCKKANGEVIKHGYSNTKTYNIWKTMKQRCDNPNHEFYYCYGGKGITYTETWANFENFLNDMGECPKTHSIERLDNSKNYCKENCKWIPLTEQSKNKSTTVLTQDIINKIRLETGCKKDIVEKYSELYLISKSHIYNILNNNCWK